MTALPVMALVGSILGEFFSKNEQRTNSREIANDYFCQSKKNE